MGESSAILLFSLGPPSTCLGSAFPEIIVRRDFGKEIALLICQNICFFQLGDRFPRSVVIHTSIKSNCPLIQCLLLEWGGGPRVSRRDRKASLEENISHESPAWAGLLTETEGHPTGRQAQVPPSMTTPSRPSCGGKNSHQPLLSRPPKVPPASSPVMTTGTMTRTGKQDPGATKQPEETEGVHLCRTRKHPVCLNSKNVAKGEIITTFILQILEEIVLHNMETTSCQSGLRGLPRVASRPGSTQGSERRPRERPAEAVC